MAGLCLLVRSVLHRSYVLLLLLNFLEELLGLDKLRAAYREPPKFLCKCLGDSIHLKPGLLLFSFSDFFARRLINHNFFDDIDFLGYGWCVWLMH